ncbi:MAG: GAF domain-containing sensor histidine kinase [Marmoricola sp.]
MSEVSVLGAPVEGSSLLDAVLLLTSDLDLRGALDRLVRAACALTGAEYGVLALVDETGGLADFVIHGIDEETAAAIPSLPTGHGLLGLLLDDAACPMRVDSISQDRRAMGFPVNHPLMETFLGVPVRVDGRVYGNLYLTEKADGLPFTVQDEKLLAEFAQIAGLVIGNARALAGAESRQRWLEASIAMSHALERSVNPPAALDEVVRRLCDVAGAFAAGAVRDAEDDGLVLVAAVRADGEPCDAENLTERWGAAIDAAATGDRAVLAERSSDALVRIVVPMSARLLRGHYLLVALAEDDLELRGPDLELYSAFADQASLVLDRAQALSERHEHLLVVDRDRIARDLHDTVIQRLFATALQLQGLRRVAVLDEVKQRLDESVRELNTTIREIRSTIFELRHDERGSLKAEIRGLALEYVPVLGFTPFVRLRGPIDDAVPAAVAEQLVASLRETLSNVARHAEADACIVEVEVSASGLVLRVSDNGRGISADVNESGLRNVRRRAFDQGGTFRIGPEEPHGTLVEWSVPIR